MSASSSVGPALGTSAACAADTAENAIAIAPAAGGHIAPSAEVAIVDTADSKTPLMESIRILKEQQKKMKDEKTRIQKELRNAEKRRRRLKKRARQLTEDDLVEVLQMRRTVEEIAHTTAVEGGHSESSSGSSTKD